MKGQVFTERLGHDYEKAAHLPSLVEREEKTQDNSQRTVC